MIFKLLHFKVLTQDLSNCLLYEAHLKKDSKLYWPLTCFFEKKHVNTSSNQTTFLALYI